MSLAEAMMEHVYGPTPTHSLVTLPGRMPHTWMLY
jgi:hypothetical protein